MGVMRAYQLLQNSSIFCFQWIQVYHFLIAVFTEPCFHIIHVCNTTAHSCSKVATGFPKNNHRATSHIFTAVIPYSFYNHCSTGVTHTESFTSYSSDVRSSRSRTIKSHVPNNDILFRYKSSFLRWIDDELGTT